MAKIMCVTGHRPNKMPQYGYNIDSPAWGLLKKKFKQILVENECNEGISGMALGVDTVFALAVLELKNEGYDIKLHCAIPCKNHSRKWPEESRRMYNSILEQADKVVIVTDAEYNPWLMQKRNEYMVDIADKVLAVWNGLPGGTENCIKYAHDNKKDVIYINPITILQEQVSDFDSVSHDDVEID